MCGVLGLFALDESVRSKLGALFVPMLTAMGERGPDSAGVAVYRNDAGNGRRKFSFYDPSGRFDWDAFEQKLSARFGDGLALERVGSYALVNGRIASPDLRRWLGETALPVRLMGSGEQMEIYKGVGAPAEVAERYGIAKMAADCMIGHTRMATESVVDVAGSHPYAAGDDLCMVHNGSLANHNSLRRVMERDRMRFDSRNDTEVAARFVQWRLGKGEPLKEALDRMMETFSGFFTLAIGFKDHFAVVRDPYACKPLVVAESDRYVACASEFRALAHLPDPKPASGYLFSEITLDEGGIDLDLNQRAGLAAHPAEPGVTGDQTIMMLLDVSTVDPAPPEAAEFMVDGGDEWNFYVVDARKIGGPPTHWPSREELEIFWVRLRKRSPSEALREAERIKETYKGK